MCSRSAYGRALKIPPTANTPGMSEVVSADRNQTKPTAVISAPKRFSGRRHQANSPVPMNDQPTSGVNTTAPVCTSL